MSRDELIEARLYRLEELRKYQSYYGPNTPYPVIAEINDLEAELRQLLQAAPSQPRRTRKKKKKPARPFWQMSGPTFEVVATIALIGLAFLFGSVIFAAYTQNRPQEAAQADSRQAELPAAALAEATLRPTFTPTADPNGPQPETAGVIIVEADTASLLPPAQREPTPIPTVVPTLTPSSTPVPTEAPQPTDTPTPLPTEPPPPPQPAAAVRPAATPTPAEPEPAPAPSFPFIVAEQGNRTFQPTSYHIITIYAAVVSEGNIPLGDLKLIGDHTPSGQHVESAPSAWFWSVTNCLDCGYVKQGNIKLEPGPFTDGTWNIYLADGNGTPLSPVLPLSYSADPSQWVWDFVIFRRVNG